MYTTIVIRLSLVLVWVNGQSTSLIDYYVNLIQNGIEKAYDKPIVVNAYEHRPYSAKTYTDYGSFDYIIIGAGTTGAVIASRLSEDITKTILLLEAGGRESNFSTIPGMAPYLLGLGYNWNYYSVPQTTSCLGMSKKQCAYPRGKGLGGTSIINGLVLARGNKEDYDNWYKEGNVGWSYNDVLPYFKKMENFMRGDPYYRGVGGPVNIEYYSQLSLQAKAFLEANLELGRKFVDYNAKEQLGASKPQFCKRNGERESTGRVYLQRAFYRKNLQISTKSFVIKILVNKEKRAYGVLFVKNGKLYIAKSRKDIILSAGVIGSPQILMLSGIGPKLHLNNLKIPVVEDLPVGNGLMDHVGYFNLEFTGNYAEPLKTLRENIINYINNRGPLTNPYNIQGIAFVQTKYAKNETYPDMLLDSVPSAKENPFFADLLNYNLDTFNALNNENATNRTFAIHVTLLHPKSQGHVRLNSVDPFDYPQIDPRFLSDTDDKDIDTIYEGIQMALRFMDTKSFKGINAELKDNTFPACKRNPYLSKEYWYCQIRQTGTSAFNPIGTCKMGPHPSKGAVVNPELKVFGIKNLRVADTSVFPTTTSGNPAAAAIMIGEKVADLLK
ncbi:hypothetical protein FQA39_LY06038 [Lamprigera yunnana]|nr:hypothetical protein FQA39_LY06038 [Lamprigera yunnana]